MSRLFCLPVLIASLAVAGCSSQSVRIEEEQLLKSSDINTELGLAYLEERDFERALKRLLKAVEQNPDNARAHTVIALVYDNLDRPDKADLHYARGVALDPQDSYGQNAYAAFLCRRGDIASAEQRFKAALENPLYAQPEVALTNAGLCVATHGDREGAETYFRSALRRNPKFAPALYQMARISFDQGVALSARAYLQRYLEVGKHTPQTLWLGIQVERELGDRDAVSSYALLLQGQFPDSEEARLLEQSRAKSGGRKR